MNTDAEALISIVVPAYSEQEVLPKFHERITAVCSQLPLDVEIVYVNDGSTDNTLEVLDELYKSDDRVMPETDSVDESAIAYRGNNTLIVRQN